MLYLQSKYITTAMNINIRTLLLELLKHQFVVSSWGLTNIKIGASKLSFDVDGLLYKGKVLITVNGCLYTIHLDSRTLSDVALCQVVAVLDGLIEVDEDYKEQLAQWLALKRKRDVKTK